MGAPLPPGIATRFGPAGGKGPSVVAPEEGSGHDWGVLEVFLGCLIYGGAPTLSGKGPRGPLVRPPKIQLENSSQPENHCRPPPKGGGGGDGPFL